MNIETIRVNWPVAKGRLKQEFPELSEDDFDYLEGEEEELLVRLERRTGRTRAVIALMIATMGLIAPRSVSPHGA